MSIFNERTPYQRMSRLVRACRWCRYKPTALVQYYYRAAMWVLSGCPRYFGLSRRNTLGLIRSSIVGMAEVRMGHYYVLRKSEPE